MKVIQPHLLFYLKKIVYTALVDSKYVLQALFCTVKYNGNKLEWLDPGFLFITQKKHCCFMKIIK